MSPVYASKSSAAGLPQALQSAHPLSIMMKRLVNFYSAVVRKTAIGVENNPDTYVLIKKPAILLRVGVRLRLYTRDKQIYSHLGWAVIERVRTVEREEVEFIICRVGEDSEDEIRGVRHFLVAERNLTAAGWSTRHLIPRIIATWRNLYEGVERVERTVPPTPPASLPATPPPSEVSLSTISFDHDRDNTLAGQIPSLESSVGATVDCSSLAARSRTSIASQTINE